MTQEKNTVIDFKRFCTWLWNVKMSLTSILVQFDFPVLKKAVI